MTDLPFRISAKTCARIGGGLYLLIIAIGLWSEAFVREKLVVSGDAAATSSNIRSMESLWRVAIGAELILLLCAVTTTWIFLLLMRPVNADLAWLATFFNLISIALEAGIQLNLLAVLFPLGNDAYLKAFTPEQLSTIAYLPLRLHGYGFGLSPIFFACFCLVMGYLIFRSKFFPRALGILFQIAGLCYLTNTFALLVAPHFADRIFPAILVPSFIGELSLALWLTVKGVDAAKWELALWRALFGCRVVKPQQWRTVCACAFRPLCVA
jgi:Domain of unknown function (DUF4386)